MPTLVRMCGPAEGVPAGEGFDQEVLVRIPLSGQFGSDEEQVAVMALADELTAIVAGAGTAEFDGYEFGDSEATLFAYGADADELFALLEPALRAAPLACGAVVTKRYGRADDPSAREETMRL
jgi:hypothetical protein